MIPQMLRCIPNHSCLGAGRRIFHSLRSRTSLVCPLAAVDTCMVTHQAMPKEAPSHLLPSHTSRLSQSIGLGSLCIQHLPMSYQFYTWRCIFVNATLSIHLTLFFPHGVHRTVLHVCISISALQIGSSVTFF